MTFMIISMPDAKYFAINNRCSASSIKGAFKKSPAHYQAEKNKQSNALSFGSIAHTAILEPSKFRDRYIIAPEVNKRTKAGKEALAKFEAVAGDRQIISNDDQSKVFAMKEVFRAHKTATDLIEQDGPIEKVVLFELFDIPFKAKLDKIAIVDNSIVDYKTSRDASANSFGYDYIKYGYHIQGYIYQQAAIAAGYNVDKVKFIVQESAEPHAISVFTLPEDALTLAELKVQELAPQWYECFKSGVWPGYSEEVIELELPYSARKELEAYADDMLEF